MQILIAGKKLGLTEAIKSYAETKIGKLDKFYKKIIRADLTLGMNSSHHLKGKKYFAECKLEIPGKDLFVEIVEDDIYKAIDELEKELKNRIKKQKVKQNPGRENKHIRKIRRDVKEDPGIF